MSNNTENASADSAEKQGHFREITIPGDVLDDENLSDGAKIMYGKIARLAYKTGVCWSGNLFLDGTKTGRNASRLIAELKNAGYIVIENERSKFRKIKICPVESRVYIANSGDVDNSIPDDDGVSTTPKVAQLNPLPRQNRRGNYAKNGGVYYAKSGDRTFLNPTNLNLTAAAPQPTESKTDPPPDAQPAAAAASFTPQELKNALHGLDKSFFFDEPFYPQAAAFMARHSLDSGYLKWLYRQCELKNPKSYTGWYFKVFFAENKAGQYKAARQAAAAPPPPPTDIACPACGALHAVTDSICPSCALPKDSPQDRIALFQELRKLPPEQQSDYFRREEAVFTQCGKDFVKYNALVSELQKEFGLATA